MSSDSHFEPPANSSRKCDRLKRLLKYTIPCLSNNALTSPLTDTTPVHGTSMDNGCPASLHPLFATENVESGARSTYRHYITEFRLHFTTKEPKFQPLDTVRLVIFGLTNEERDTLVLQKESQFTWRQRETVSPCEVLADTEGVTIVATSEDSIDFAHVSFTKNELGLGLGQETHEIRITKGFTSEAEVPALQLSFTIIEVFGGDINDDEIVQITTRELGKHGIALLEKFQRLGNLADISEAISVLQQAVQLSASGNSDGLTSLNNLGVALQSRFACMGDLSDLTEAISAQQRAVQLTPDGHPDMPLRLSNLGTSFQSRFVRMGDLSDLTEAISAKHRAVQLTPDGHPDMPSRLNNLGNSFQSRFARMVDFSDCHIAIGLFKTAATTIGPPSVRLIAAQNWTNLITKFGRPGAMEAYDISINLISQIVGMDCTVKQRHTDLVNISSLTTTAASVACGRGELEKALEWLEHGRCLVWSHLNQLRTPVDDLRTHDSHLAQRFLEISNALESSGSLRGIGAQSIDAPMSQKVTLEDEARIHISLASKWTKILEEIRAIPGFLNFLRPPQALDLLSHIPPDGPIILINVDKSRCDALALIPGCPEPIQIPLTKFTYEQASKLRDHLRKFLSWHGVRVREENRALRPAPAYHVESNIHFVLGVLWLEVVRPILEALSYSYADSLEPRRIWWCPTGPLAFLPLHAAGIYGKARDEGSPAGFCISDFAVSSYTPTVSALLRSVKGSLSVQPPSSTKLLIISQPDTPGCSPIKGTTKEMDAIQKIIGPKYWTSLCLEGETATVSRVKLEMVSHPSVHFACHASQDIENSLKSGFYLHDGRLDLAAIMEQKITNCELAFLSACQTSTGDEKLSEEAVHLAAGMLAVGYRSVVATMWSIKDEYGPVVAEGFYKDLMEKGTTSGLPGIDSANASRALHQAIQAIRQQVGDTEQGLLTWVPYVHFGY